jgi:hypothetical protein
MENKILEAALEYASEGLSVIPMNPKDKKPLIQWSPYQLERANEEQIRRWWEKWPDANVGIVTGHLSNTFVLDCDAPEGIEIIEMNGGLPPTRVALTSYEGEFRKRHYYFNYPEAEIRNSTKKLPGLDVRGEGGYVVAPPSIHPSGVAYEWEAPCSP